MSIGPKLRFEVLKRDKFTCQYCGGAAPHVLLEVDHVDPVKNGGVDDILNLVASCKPCNAGKGARLLSDDSVILKKKKQLDEIQDRREQLQMLVAWQKELSSIDDETVIEIAQFWEHLWDYRVQVNPSGNALIRRWIKKFEAVEILEAMVKSLEWYGKVQDAEDLGPASSKAFDRVPSICVIERNKKTDPYLEDALYIRGILRKRVNYVNEKWCLKIVRDALRLQVPAAHLKEVASDVRNWTAFQEIIADLISVNSVDESEYEKAEFTAPDPSPSSV